MIGMEEVAADGWCTGGALGGMRFGPVTGCNVVGGAKCVPGHRTVTHVEAKDGEIQSAEPGASPVPSARSFVHSLRGLAPAYDPPFLGGKCLFVSA